MSYTIGVSSGWWSIARSSELLGLASKIGSTTTYGINFVQVDFESIAEFQEPDVIKNITRLLDTLQIDWGMHGEIGEGMALESAIEVVWKQSHRRLNQYLDSIYHKFFVEEKKFFEDSKRDVKKYLPKYIVFHASNLPTISMVVERYRYSGHITVDFNGNPNWLEFFDDNDEELKKAKERVKKWLFDSDLIYLLILKEFGYAISLSEIRNKLKQDFIENLVQEEIKKIVEKGEKLSEQEILKFREDFLRKLEEGDQEIYKGFEDFVWKYFSEITAARFIKGAIVDEQIAYLIVARYLYEARDHPKEPFWREFFKEKSWEDLEREENVKFFNKDSGEVLLTESIVSMVAVRYVIGHFMNKNREEFIVETKRKLGTIDKEFEKFLNLTPFSKLHLLNIKIVFENPEISRAGEEGLHRIAKAVDIYRMVKIGNEISREICQKEGIAPSSLILGMVFDQEHYLHNNMDPLKEIQALRENAKEDLGKYLVVFHAGAPKPYHPAHEPIDIGSEAQYWIYVYLYELRKMGFGKEENKAFIIFERGGARGGQIPAQFIGQSAAALRIIVEYLEKDVEPSKLPLEFYGVSSKEILSYERQLALIKEHFFDPLRGTLKVPEERYTFLSGEAIKKGKRPEEWEREELR